MLNHVQPPCVEANLCAFPGEIILNLPFLTMVHHWLLTSPVSPHRLLRHASRPGLQEALRRVQRRGIAATELRHTEQGVGHAGAAFGQLGRIGHILVHPPVSFVMICHGCAIPNGLKKVLNLESAHSLFASSHSINNHV